MNFKLIDEYINNKQYKEAYLLLTSYLEDKPHNLKALFLHAKIDFLYLKQCLILDYHELEEVIIKHGKDFDDAIIFIVGIADYLEMSQGVLLYGPQAISILKTHNYYNDELIIQILYKVAYYLYDDNYLKYHDSDSLDDAVKYINDLFDQLSDDAESYHYLLKFRIYLSKEEYETCLNILNNWESKLQASGDLFFAKALFYGEKRNPYFNKSLAFDFLDVARKYDYDEIHIIETKVNILNSMALYDESIKYLDTINNNNQMLAYNLKLETMLNDYNRYAFNILRTIEKTLRSGINDEVKYLKANLISNNYLYNNKNKHDKRLELCLKLYNEVWDKYQDTRVIYEEIILLLHEHHFKQALDILNKEYPYLLQDGRSDYLLAGLKTYLDYDLDEIIKDFDNAYKNGYLTELEYLDEIEYIVKKPTLLNKKINYYANHYILNKLDSYSSRKMGYRYLYGLFGLKKDYKKVKDLFLHQLDLDPNTSCSHTSYGRYLEIVENNQEQAFKEYNKAYEIFKNGVDECSCGVGVLIKAYVEGIGVQKDLFKAKQITLNTINNLDIAPVNTVIYYYSFFAISFYLNNSIDELDKEFSLTQAYELLKINYPFERYELVRYMYLKIISNLLNLDNNYDKQIKQCIKYANIDLKTYYKENKNKTLLYPFNGSF